MARSLSSVAALLTLTLALSLLSILAAPPLGVDEHNVVGASHPQASGWPLMSPLLGLSSKATSCHSSLEATLLVSTLMVDPYLDFHTGQWYGLGVVFSQGFLMQQILMCRV